MAGTITKRGKDTWRIRIALGAGSDGKRRTYSKTIHGSKKDADTFLTAKLREKDLGTFIMPAATNLKSYLDEWLPVHKISKSTRQSYRDVIDYYIVPKIGTMRISDIKRVNIKKLCDDLTGDGYAASTVKKVHTVLSSAFSCAIEDGLLAVNPCTKIKLPKKEHAEFKVFSAQEAKAFMHECEQTSDRLGLMFMFALDSGMRPEEYLALKWSDVNFDQCSVSVQRVLIRPQKKDEPWYFDTPKTDRSRRTVRMQPRIIERLKRHRAEQLEHMMLLGTEYKRHDLVFANEFGAPLDGHNNRRNFQRILTAAGLAHKLPMRVYDLRHSMATLMLINRESPKVVSERLGHASVATTMDIYSHVLPDMQEEATERLGRMLFG